MLGVSVRTLQDWEQGRRIPTGPARNLLRLYEAMPEATTKVLAEHSVLVPGKVKCVDATPDFPNRESRERRERKRKIGHRMAVGPCGTPRPPPGQVRFFSCPVTPAGQYCGVDPAGDPVSGGKTMASGKAAGAEPRRHNGVNATAIIPIQRVQSLILLIRGQKVILDSDLAALYGVTTARLNEQVKRNAERFPADFMFRLSPEEFDDLMSQFATSNAGRGGRRKLPYAFTEHGAIMAASVLNSPQAVRTSIYVVRAFVRLRQMLASHEDLAAKVKRLQKTVRDHDSRIVAIVDASQLLMPPPEEPPKEPFGFRRAKKN
jgi:hypothetical protein